MPEMSPPMRNAGDTRAAYPDPSEIVAKLEQDQAATEAQNADLGHPVVKAFETLTSYAMAQEQAGNPQAQAIKSALEGLMGTVQGTAPSEAAPKPEMPSDQTEPVKPMEAPKPEMPSDQTEPVKPTEASQAPMVPEGQPEMEPVPENAEQTGQGSVDPAAALVEALKKKKPKSKAIPNETRVMV